jgi:ATP-binding cassette subfamily B protein
MAVSLLAICDGLHLIAAQHIFRTIIDGLLSNQIDLRHSKPFIMVFSLLFLSGHLFLPLIREFRIRAISMVQSKMRNYLFHSTVGHPLEFFINNFAGNLNAKISDVVNGSRDFIVTIADIFSSVFIFMLLISLFFKKSHLMSVLLLIWLCVYGIIFVMISRMIMRASYEKSGTEGKYFGSLVDCFTSIYNIKSFSMESREEIDRKIESANILNRDMGLSRLKSLMDIFNFISNFILVSLVFTISIGLYLENKITVGDLTMFVTTISQVSGWFKYAFGGVVDLFELHGKMDRALNILTIPYIPENKNSSELIVSDGRIEIDHLQFRYRPSNPLVISDLSLSLEPNTKLGIVGSSGSGKSTLINLLLRLYRPEGGRILIDGQNIEDATGESLRKNISYIPQDVHLFHRTISENIAYGKPGATPEEIEHVAKKAFCYDFINNLEDRFDTIVGERGVKLSSGQRQRIAIARALLKNSKILVLDEATSALDVITESKIQNALAELMRDRTTIVIAHRLSTLDIVDRIVVLENGKILEDGTEEELMNIDGEFRRMCRRGINILVAGERVC